MKPNKLQSKNADVVRLFLVRTAGESPNMASTGDKLYSYDTVISQWLSDGKGKDRLIVNDTVYSHTTSKHQDILRRIQGESEITLLRGIDSGCQDLTPHLINK